jgi:hypothetical protein
MASTSSSNSEPTENTQPRPLHVSRSFSRLESASPTSSTRSSRANTIQNDMIPEIPSLEKEVPTDTEMPFSRTSTWDKSTEWDKKQCDGEEIPGQSTSGLDELPIELKSLADRYISMVSLTSTY